MSERGPDARSTDLASGGGPPTWLAASLNHCPSCGGPLELGTIPGEERPRLACAACGHIVYVNPRLVVSTVGAVRETLEETGLVVAPGEIIGLYSRLEAAVVVLAYEARIIGGDVRTSPEALDVRAFAPESIPWPEIAFKTTWWALVDWLGKRRPDLPAPSGARWTRDSG